MQDDSKPNELALSGEIIVQYEHYGVENNLD